MCLAGCRLHRKEGSRNAQRDSTSFPELNHLVRMNNQMRITWFVVRGSKIVEMTWRLKKYLEVDFP